QTTLERFGQVALPPGAVRDGEVIDSEAVAAAIRELWARVKFSTKKVVVGVANQKVIVRQLDLPWMPIAELRKSLAFQVADVIPMPVEHAILDLHPLEEVEDENGRRQRILLVAASRDMVSSLISAVESAGLTPTSVDLNSFAVLRVLADVDRLGLSRRAEALVDVGASVTNIVVSEGGVPRFVRILLMGGADITESIADRMGIGAEQAEAIKQHEFVPASPDAPGISPMTRITESAADAWVEEVRGSLDYYFAQAGAARVSRIVLSGGGSQLGGLARRLAMTTGVPVEPATPLAPMQIGKTGLTDAQLDYVQAFSVVPVGLAMAGAA
ncbi:MAG TPA: type IV pilus assembly protein PilM, partial [Frankiaceae bacterium]|nr:type IV pilus assembly protein PilM [Frankiaceae bacterium]